MHEMTKVVFIKSYFRPVGKEETIEVPTGEIKTGFFGGEKKVTRKEKQWKQTGWSDSEIDGEKLASDLKSVTNELKEQGYKITSITPVLSGAYNYKFSSRGISSSPRLFSETEAVSGGGSYGFGYGYSYTEGLIVVAEISST